mmetsp:Transcript_33085/g.32460  ORF Transcript_33085/g.32460 Transcript_33085/m.32460 type:complete len:335 (-) Transcript_33085:1055-2059(-)
MYYILRLGFYFSSFPVSFTATIIISVAFYGTNQAIYELEIMKERKASKDSAKLNFSMYETLDNIPYPILVEQEKEIVIFNRKFAKLLKIEQIDEGVKDCVFSKLKQTDIEIEDKKFIKRLNKVGKKLSYSQGSNFKNQGYLNNQNTGKGAREESKGIAIDNIGSSFDFGSENSVSDSEERLSHIEPTTSTLYEAIFTDQKINEQSIVFDKEEMRLAIQDRKFILKSKSIKWNDKDAKIHIFEQSKLISAKDLNPHINNEQYKLIMSQYASELTKMLQKVDRELSEAERSEEQFQELKKSINHMTSVMREIVATITFDGENPCEEQKSEFTIDSL